MLHNYRKLAVLGVALFLAGCQAIDKRHSPAPAAPAQQPTAVSVPHLFSDNMVLQRDANVPIWGWGAEGATVTVTFRDQIVRTQVRNGRWGVYLHSLKPG
jgi:hypothetical protein